MIFAVTVVTNSFAGIVRLRLLTRGGRGFGGSFRARNGASCIQSRAVSIILVHTGKDDSVEVHRSAFALFNSHQVIDLRLESGTESEWESGTRVELEFVPVSKGVPFLKSLVKFLEGLVGSHPERLPLFGHGTLADRKRISRSDPVGELLPSGDRLVGGMKYLHVTNGSTGKHQKSKLRPYYRMSEMNGEEHLHFLEPASDVHLDRSIIFGTVSERPAFKNRTDVFGLISIRIIWLRDVFSDLIRSITLSSELIRVRHLRSGRTRSGGSAKSWRNGRDHDSRRASSNRRGGG
ncbi:hypothetical protein MJO28_016531 [Puccinia striiformis f. sp. tritici]|uniref:Uncharacterized protein n=1 Tax=Puccinia striiformis f. sp. tritici TaxID=168172 RepID=A0ACC0DN90_9BASI|nr:hypothetical protein MJO28_016531 [Puccinia striiformis f. sp. tritici]